MVLLAGAGVLLLIAWLNVITLLLARSEGRKREIAVRSSLGATSARLCNQFVVEGLVLAGAGGVLALVFAEWGMLSLANLVPANKIDSMPYFRGLGSDLHTIACACFLSLLAQVFWLLSQQPEFRWCKRWKASGKAHSVAPASRGGAWARISST